MWRAHSHNENPSRPKIQPRLSRLQSQCFCWLSYPAIFSWFTGFDIQDCDNVPSFNTLVTVVVNCVKYTEKRLAEIPAALSELQKLYPGVQVSMGMWSNVFCFCFYSTFNIHVYIGTKPTGIAKLHPPSYWFISYQAFEPAGFEQDLPRNETKGTVWDHVFQFTYTLKSDALSVTTIDFSGIRTHDSLYEECAF